MVLGKAMEDIGAFSSSRDLGSRIFSIEYGLEHKDVNALNEFLKKENIGKELFESAMTIKRMAGQINVIIHAIGILVALPHILDSDEQIESLSLGAGNAGKAFDLETSKRVAEFKFISWQGGPEAIRQNSLFVDLFNLASCKSEKKKCLYLVGMAIPKRFLMGRRNLKSVLSKNRSAYDRFFKIYGNKYSCVVDYYNDVKDAVEIVDLTALVPYFKELA